MKLKYSRSFVFCVFALLLLAQACRKHDGEKPDEKVDKQIELSEADIDSLKYYIWKINLSDKGKNVPIYFWEDQVPDDFDWKSSAYKSGNDVMRAIASYPTYQGEQVDRYSLIDMQGSIADELERGILGDYGFSPGVALDGNNKRHLFVEYVYKDSPADREGMRRGDEIVGINGSSDFNYNDGSLDRQLFQSEQISLTLNRGGSGTFSMDLETEEYHLNPILFDTIYTVGSEKVGYFVYNSFVVVGNRGNNAVARQELNDVFFRFKTEGVSDLIVDLRYNGGGAVVTSEYLANLIGSSSAAGEVMYKYEYNQPLTDFYTENKEYASFLEPEKFKEESNHLDLSRVFFIVSGGTASASELTMNNLKPYLDVKLVGDRTYGKPVGFFTTPIEFVVSGRGTKKTRVADMYSINFRTVNSQGEGDYYFGMEPDVEIYDFIDINWGDPQDPRLQTIFSYIKGNGFLTQQDIDAMGRKRRSAGEQHVPFNALHPSSSARLVNPSAFRGMVDYRMKKED